MSHNLGNGIHMTVKGSHGYCAIKTIEVRLPSTTGSAGGGGSSSLTS